MVAKFIIFSLFAIGALARPQLGDDQEGPFDPNPKYSFSYQVSDDVKQTYLAHKEQRDGDDVTGEYSYVDPLGSLITVTYTAGVGGYQETRNVREGFVSINQQSSTTGFVAPARPVIAPQQPAVSTATSSSNSDLVGNIISQLTPFIQQTVSSTLSSSSTQSAVQTAPVQTVTVTQRPIVVAPPAPAGSSIEGVFGLAGQNNVQFETPNFNFNYDLQK